MEEFDKKYYKIRDVAEMLDVNASTLRYWEDEFPEVKPYRSPSNQRFYRPEDIKILQIIKFLVKTKGLRVEAAKKELAVNRKNISRRVEAVQLLIETRNQLQGILNALNKRR